MFNLDTSPRSFKDIPEDIINELKELFSYDLFEQDWEYYDIEKTTFKSNNANICFTMKYSTPVIFFPMLDDVGYPMKISHAIYLSRQSHDDPNDKLKDLEALARRAYDSIKEYLGRPERIIADLSAALRISE